MINYKTFTKLYKEASDYNDLDYYIAERGWEQWMDPFEENPEIIINIISLIYQYSRESIKDIRKRLGYSRAQFSRTYQIPLRTLENWDVKHNLPVYTEIIIKYTLFLEEFTLCFRKKQKTEENSNIEEV